VRVLLALDDAACTASLEKMLSKLGHECVVATDATAAWQALSTSDVEVVLTEPTSKGVDGLELCRRVRHELDDRHVYLVLVTAPEHHQKVLAGVRAGADDCLTTPVDPVSVWTCLVGAERVTSLHRELVDVRRELLLAIDEMSARSLTDTLTGLSNRRRMDEDLDNMHARAQRLGRTYGVALLDIDHFRAYNDHYGALGGDELLRRVAHRFVNDVRAGERVYRMGGEEFLLLMDDCTPDGATVAAERLGLAVASLGIPHESRPDSPPIVTLSGGVACWAPGTTRTVPELLAIADTALVEAKSAGRNRICSADTPVTPGQRA
jgi:diguanylate cyclase (GGDEF)-like protein